MHGHKKSCSNQYDKSKEAGGVPATDLSAYLVATGGADKNPWDPTTGAFNTTIGSGKATDQAGALAEISALAKTKGLVEFALALPGSGTPGFIEGAVLCDNTQSNATKIVAKATAIE